MNGNFQGDWPSKLDISGVKGMVAGSMNFGFREIFDKNQHSQKPRSANVGSLGVLFQENSILQ